MHEIYGLMDKEYSNEEYMNLISMQMTLIEEEYEEAMNAIEDVYSDIAFLGEPSVKKLQAAAKELADLEVVSIGMAHILGINSDKVFNEVMKSNLSKKGKSGRIERRPDGKVLKGKHYQKPDLSDIMVDK
jgi:predicted HAD superfamily Cof-like phosphohydrolase